MSHVLPFPPTSPFAPHHFHRNLQHFSLTHTHTNQRTHSGFVLRKMGHNLETKSLFDELKSFDRKGGLFDLGHPLLNRMAESFVKAAGVRISLFLFFYTNIKCYTKIRLLLIN